MMRVIGPGGVLGGYQIDRVVGRGGMGLVYRARQRRPERVVALKVIAPELAADPDFRARFEQESSTAALIEHPNVIPVYEVGEDDGVLFLVMRFVQGVDLGRLLAERGRLEPERAARLISQVADALDAAHARGLVHRDVKPGNIMIAAQDHVYLTDFGLTKRTTETRGVTRTGMVVGTVDYIAPEQVEGRPVDARTDEYALGCVAFEALSGSVPFERDSDVATMLAHVKEPAPRLQGVPAPLADAVQRALSKRPEDRFASTGEFGRAVVAGAAGQTVDAAGRPVATGDETVADPQATTPPGGTPAKPVAEPRAAAPAGRRRRAKRWRLAAGAAGVLLLAGAGLAIALTTAGGTPRTCGSRPACPHPTPPPPNPNRATLAPATSPPKVDECEQQLQFGADGTAGPPTCANGDVNAVAWKYYAQGGDHDRVLSLGAFATPTLALQAMCAERTTTTVPQELMAYRLARAYYGWNFAVDPSSSYPGGCSQ